MANTQLASRTCTLTAQGVVSAKRLINVRGLQASVAGEACLGVADTSAIAGDNFLVILGDSAIVTAGAAINNTVTALQTDNQGRVIPWVSPAKIVGYLRPGDTAQGAGETVEMFNVLS